jgi:molecular chaperone GrpE (heat shock protein)
MAETENVRKMGFERIDEAKKFAVQNLIKDLIVVFDTLDIALGSVKG